MPCRRLICTCTALAALIGGCSSPDPVPVPANAVIYVVQRDWHTDIGLPVDEIAGPLARLEKSFPGVRFLTFGFGERQFLVNRRTDSAAMLSALLPSRSALLMTALRATPEQAFGSDSVVRLRISRAGLEAIEATIWQEFELSPGGEPKVMDDGPYPGSRFYAARDTYDALYTCNTWSADVLRAGGMRMPGAVLFAGQIMGMVRWIGVQQAATQSAVLPGHVPVGQSVPALSSSPSLPGDPRRFLQ
jgi:uncharacterized protein (TIGR02117 family)